MTKDKLRGKKTRAVMEQLLIVEQVHAGAVSGSTHSFLYRKPTREFLGSLGLYFSNSSLRRRPSILQQSCTSDAASFEEKSSLDVLYFPRDISPVPQLNNIPK